MNFINCQNLDCNRKLLMIDNFNKLSIKCPRCKHINNFSSVLHANIEDHESQTNGEKPRGTIRHKAQKQNKAQPQSTR